VVTWARTSPRAAADRRRQDRSPAVRGQQAQELLGRGVEACGIRDGRKPLALVVGAERRRIEKDAQIAAVGDRGLQRLQVRFDLGDQLLVFREIEEGLGIPAAHVRSLGIIRHLKCPSGARRKPQRSDFPPQT
jgi:hypothetical protein